MCDILARPIRRPAEMMKRGLHRLALAHDAAYSMFITRNFATTN